MMSYEKIEQSSNKISKIIEKVDHTITNTMWEGMAKFLSE